MKLSIVIPAYNEENAIAATLQQTLAARREIIGRSCVDEVEVIVVSDGSTDRTAEIASGFDGVRLIVLPENQGYGAALKRGFAESSGDLVSFLDADGTCDPRFFAELCTALADQDAVMALGSRLGPGTCMPRVRRLGNRLYAAVLSVLSNRVVHDVASGMRVIRRDALSELGPLPDGLHFTPALSARALLDDRLRIVEVPMPYRERVGESKLSVLRDGARFLRAILEMTLVWRPARIFMTGALLCGLMMLLLAMHPLEMWLHQGRLDEDLIYRLLFCSFLGTVGVTLTSAYWVSARLRDFAAPTDRRRTLTGTIAGWIFSWRGLAVLAALGVPLATWLVGPGVWTYLTQRRVFIHWSRVILAGLIVFVLCQIGVTAVVVNVMRLHVEKLCPAPTRRSGLRSGTRRGHAHEAARPRRRQDLSEDPVVAGSR